MEKLHAQKNYDNHKDWKKTKAPETSCFSEILVVYELQLFNAHVVGILTYEKSKLYMNEVYVKFVNIDE